jgi:hypothetical protein
MLTLGKQSLVSWRSCGDGGRRPPVETELQSLVDVFVRFREDPCISLRPIRVDPTPQQRLVLEAVRWDRRQVNSDPGRHGEDTALAWRVLWHTLCFRTPGPLHAPPVFSSTILWAEIAKWLCRMPDWFRRQIVVQSEFDPQRGGEHTRSP